jgi:predicted Zn-dependent protease
MTELEPQHRFAILAAQGWLELGNPKESSAELDALPNNLRTHPATLEMRWNISAHLADWKHALELAISLLQLDPENPAGWINQSFCLHEMKRTQDAWNALLPASKKFPLVGTIPYNLACYACQLGRETLAIQWLTKAARLLDRKQFKDMVKHDPDLEPIRDQIKNLLK